MTRGSWKKFLIKYVTTNLKTARPPTIWSRGTLKAFLKDIQGYLALPPKLNVWEWAEKNIFLSPEVTAEPGFYNADRLPYQKIIQEWMTDSRVNDIVMVTAAQLAKTTVINNAVGYFMAADPSSILVVYPTIDDSQDWIRDKFMPMVLSSERLRKLIPREGTRTTGQTTLVKHFPGGRLKATGANSPSALRGRTFRVIIQDDLDGFKDNAEGDPSAQADRRAASQPRALRMKFSTPTVKGGSRVWSLLEQSTFHQLLCPCHACGHEQVLVWDNMVFEASKPEDARYKCSGCGELWTDQDRYNAVMRGARGSRYSIRNPEAKIKGMHISGLYRVLGEKNSMSGFLEEFVREYITAKAQGEKAYQVWVNTFLAECYEPANSTIEPGPLHKRREDYQPLVELPDQVLVIVAAVDVQGNRLEVEVRGFGLGQESWGIEYREFAGDPTEQLVWKRIDAFLSQSYKHPVRGQMKIGQVFIDAGGSKQNETYVFTEVRNGRGIYACRGAKDINAPALSPLRKAGYNQVPFYFVGTQGIKDTLHSRLLLRASGPGYLHFPVSDDYDETYFKNLTAEKKTIQETGANRGKMMWVKPDGARNEPWDINVYMIGAMEAAGYTERHLRGIARENERLKSQMAAPPKPPSNVMTIASVIQGVAETKADAPIVATPSPVQSVKPELDLVAKNKDITAPMNTPMTPKVQPRRPSWKVTGKGHSGFGGGFPGWGG